MLAGLAGATLLATGMSVPEAGADPAETEAEKRGSRSATQTAGGRGAGTATTVSPVERAEVVRRAARVDPPVAGDPIEMPTSYPSQPTLPLYRDNPDDAALTPKLLGHPDLAPLLNEWMGESDRISAQVVGQSTAGRDLYLVTVTAPESEAETARQTAWREKVATDPVAAAADTTLLGQYKTPVWFSNNIHGNEWEGTDAAMAYIDELVHAPTSEVGSILRNNRLYFSLSLNPDGRTLATRATALGLDPNRDLITNTTPETKSFVRTAQAIQPIYSADFHGYTSVLQVEPTGPPHGSNYEYDVYLPHNYALALQVEQDVVAAAIPGNTYLNTTTGQVVPANTSAETAHIKIPYRDTPSGWDDFPPIFTAQYAAFFGASTSTVELPLTRGAAGGRQTPERAAINKAVAVKTYESMVGYLNNTTNARAMLLNQIEVFRRGVLGEPKTSVTTANLADIPGPQQWKQLWDVTDDQEPVTLPRAYVIPVGDDQRSASDANNLVRQLLFNDIEVGRLTADTTVGETTYPAGSYVVDLHQAKRGLANSLLDLGDDISQKLPSMYDISAWSYSYLWGASVDKVGLTTDAAIGDVEPVTAPTPLASTPGSGYLTLESAGVADMKALNALLEDQVEVSLLEDGTLVVGPEDRAAVEAVSETYDVAVDVATDEEVEALDAESTKGLTDLTVAYVGTQDDKLSLLELGFDDLVNVTAAGVNTAATNGTPTGLEDADLLWIGGSFTQAAGSPGRAAVQAFVDSGRSIVGRTNQALTVASTYGILTGTTVNGNSSGNGIVDVDVPAGSVLAPYAGDTSFVYPAYWFTGLSGNAKVEQTFGASPMLAGHWRRGTSGGQPVANGPQDAAGQASAVSAVGPTGAKAFVFGTSVFFRTHFKAGATQAARAIFWAGPSGDGVAGPDSTTVTLSAPAAVTYPTSTTFTVDVTAEGGTPSGEVTIVDATDREVGSAAVVDGSASVKAVLRPGNGSYTAVFTPDSAEFLPAASAPVSVRVAKSASTTALSVTKVGPRLFRVTIKLTAPVPSDRIVKITDHGKEVRRFTLTGSTTSRTVSVTLRKGNHVLRGVFLGNDLSVKSASANRTVKVN
ncbi:M14 family metallopeptidase [Nocardioides plantarum]|uniref:M14 family zinc carboxypeptidase n=1 Tax=Nocardioides plantarum TaxID=29299 RepID=A0ABV5K798_9ACTN|nr:M14 family metallopeptidase [Nocardioides plantarum]